MNKRHYEHTLPNIRGSLSNTYNELTFVLQALRMGFLPRSNSAKLVPGTGGKDVDSVIVVSRYLTKYQKIIKGGGNYFEW